LFSLSVKGISTRSKVHTRSTWSSQRYAILSQTENGILISLTMHLNIFILIVTNLMH